jgi:recyclin-1
VKQLDFTPMDAFISHVLEAFRIDAETASKVFPPPARVLLSFCDRVANDVVSSCIEMPRRADDRLVNTSLHYYHKQESFHLISSYKPQRLHSSKLGS